jgi:uncharacterized membrane protein YgdD (TMEM256/DUF423 family)
MLLQASARRFCMLAALLLALATIIGALAAHAFKPRLPPDQYAMLQTALQYQSVHALGLMAIGLLYDRAPGRALQVAGWLMFCGVMLFSGSLYLLLAGAPRPIGVLTPIGGLALLAGWCAVALALGGKRAA